jgi:AhpD family alkylhydroperoxidase
MDLKIHTVETAPAAAKPLLQGSLDKFKFIPNLHGIMAEAPALLEAYQTMGNLWAKTSLSVLERQIVLLTINYENGCHYCMAAHSAIATMERMPDDILTALRSNTPIADEKLQALREFARIMVQKRGWVTDADIRMLLNAGYDRQVALEVVLAVSYKVLSNYTNHIAETPLDEPFEKFHWEEPEKAAAE